MHRVRPTGKLRGLLQRVKEEGEEHRKRKLAAGWWSDWVLLHVLYKQNIAGLKTLEWGYLMLSHNLKLFWSRWLFFYKNGKYVLMVTKDTSFIRISCNEARVINARGGEASVFSRLSYISYVYI